MKDSDPVPNAGARALLTRRADMSSRSGPTLTEQRWRELGRVRLQLRLPAETVARLDALCEASGFGRGEQIAALVDAETDLGPIQPRANSKKRA